MYKRDFAILILSACAIYFTMQHEGAFSYRRAWYHHMDQDPALLDFSDVLPPPIAVDLNGDGRVEVITASHDARLQVLAPRRPGHAGEGFAKAGRLADVSLRPEGPNEESGGHRAVALAAGYLDPKRDELVRALRKQVVVVVTANWDVLCFDHNLRLQWTARVQEELPRGAAHVSVKEVAIHISNHTMRKGDRGVVVIGASAELGDLANHGDAGRAADEDALEQELAAEREQQRLHASRTDKDSLEDIEGAGGLKGLDISRHFSYYAFDGGSGALRWKHEGMDFHREAEHLAEELVPQHNFRLDAASLEGKHYGEVACRDFRESVLAVMPHRWGGRADTRLHLAHFSHHRLHGGDRRHRLPDLADAEGGDQPRGRARERPHRRRSAPADRHGIPHANPVASALGKVVEGAAKGGGPASAQGLAHQTFAPNVLVAHLEEGIEAVHLYSGRTLCKLHLPAPGLHADLNGDGVLDHVQVAFGRGSPDGHGSGGHRHTPGCWAVARSGIPPREALFNGTICRFPGQWGAPATARGFNYGSNGGVVSLEVAAPAFLPVPGPRGLYQQGHGLAIFLNSRGEVTAYNAHGERIWQQALGLAWSNSGSLGGHKRIWPTLEPLSLRSGGVPAAVLAAGASQAVILTEHAHRLEHLFFPAAPALPLQIVDFNGDYLNDIILVTHDGLYGWAQVRHPGGVPYAVLMACLIVAMAVVYITQQAAPSRGGAKIGRSTDRVD